MRLRVHVHVHVQYCTCTRHVQIDTEGRATFEGTEGILSV